jgi:preprotein translocase SecE subunit
MLTAAQSYIRGSIEDLKTVRWPTRQQAIRLSIIVIVFVAISSAAFGVVDFLLSQLVKVLLSIT